MINSIKVFIDKNVSLNFGLSGRPIPESGGNDLNITIPADALSSHIKKRMVCFLTRPGCPKSYGTIMKLVRNNGRLFITMRVEPQVSTGGVL